MEQEPRDPGQLAAQPRRGRIQDTQARLSPVRRRAFAVLGPALVASGPWLGYWFLIPLAIALAASGYAAKRSGRDRVCRAGEALARRDVPPPA